jgi:cytochrome c2
MNSSLMLYARMSGLFAVLLAMVGFYAAGGLHRRPTSAVWYVPGSDAERGRTLIQEHGCGACHTVPGVSGATGKVGPRLDRLQELVYVAGVLPNTPQNLVFWIADPKQADPRTAMPDLGVSRQDARDIAAYLYQLP